MFLPPTIPPSTHSGHYKCKCSGIQLVRWVMEITLSLAYRCSEHFSRPGVVSSLGVGWRPAARVSLSEIPNISVNSQLTWFWLTQLKAGGCLGPGSRLKFREVGATYECPRTSQHSGEEPRSEVKWAGDERWHCLLPVFLCPSKWLSLSIS